ncbi:MAG: response regulator [Candidatus Thiodiazotropha sp. (ex Semelilucina semeliformis)]|nr:response regulator [Candidatus Thiodiazotropha sp. (ex Semelilucina semeliformis)]
MVGRLPLRRMLPMALVVFIIPPMILLSYWHFQIGREALLARYQKQAEIAMVSFHRFVENGLILEQHELLDHAVVSLADYTCFSRVVGVNDKQIIFLSSRNVLVGQLLQDVDPMLASTWPDRSQALVRFKERNSTMEAFHPITINSQDDVVDIDRVGWLYLELDLSQVLSEHAQSVARHIITASFVVLLFAILLWWWLTRNLTNPLSVLTGAVKALANGDCKGVIQEGGSFEISLLARAFNEMDREINNRYHALNRQKMFYRALSETNQTILYAHDEDALFQGVCRAVVKAGIKLVWIGYLDGRADSLRIAYVSGDDTDWLGTVRKHIGLDKDPLAMSIKQGKERIINIDADNTNATHWHAEAKLNGFTAGAALPLSRGGKKIGGLVAMLDDHTLLDETGMQLLREIVADLGYALDGLDKEAARRQVEQRLAGDRALLRTLIDTIPDMIFFKDSVQTYLGCNRAFEKLVAMPEVKVVGGMDQDVLPEHLAREFHEQDKQILQSGLAERSSDWMEYPDGRRVLMDIVKSPYRGADGKVMGLIGVGRDITAEFQAGQLQQQTLERLQNAERLSNLGSWAYDPNTGQTHLSEMVYTILGFNQDKITPHFKHYLQRCLPEDRKQIKERFKALMAGKIDEFLQEHRIVLPDGEIRHLITRGRASKDSVQAFGMMGTLQDITAQKVAEEERNRAWEAVRKAQKFEAIGELTGGVVRDLNNILAPILGFSEMARRSDNISHEKLQVYLQHISESAVRGRNLIAHLMSMSRDESVVQAKAQDLPPLIEKTVNMLHATLPPGIHISVECEQKIPRVMINPVHLDLMVVNLCVNARDAIGNNGEIRICISKVQNPNVTCTACGSEVYGDYIELCVVDSGKGMLKEQLGKLFDPFYTTKRTDIKKSRMGLVALQGLLKNYGGHVSVESEPDKGSRFRLFLKHEVDEESLQSDTQHTAMPDQPFNSQRVLLVDDEASVTLFMQEYLELKGLRVEAFTDSEKALQHFIQAPASFDLLITDQAMPAITGIKLIERIHEIRPEMPVMLCTGYSADVTADNAAERGIDYYLDKPVVLDDLLSALYTCLYNLDRVQFIEESKS